MHIWECYILNGLVGSCVKMLLAREALLRVAPAIGQHLPLNGMKSTFPFNILVQTTPWQQEVQTCSIMCSSNSQVLKIDFATSYKSTKAHSAPLSSSSFSCLARHSRHSCSNAKRRIAHTAITDTPMSLSLPVRHSWAHNLPMAAVQR